jgi:hypothetical protein
MIWVSIFGLGVCVSLISTVGFYLCVSDTAKSYCFGGFVSIDTGGGTVALVSKIPHVCLTIRMQPPPNPSPPLHKNYPSHRVRIQQRNTRRYENKTLLDG